jgi:hypothetical protein
MNVWFTVPTPPVSPFKIPCAETVDVANVNAPATIPNLSVLLIALPFFLNTAKLPSLFNISIIIFN